jgi:hypothetical protein
MKKDDLVGWFLIVGTLLYVGAHVVLAVLRPLLPAIVSVVSR